MARARGAKQHGAAVVLAGLALLTVLAAGHRSAAALIPLPPQASRPGYFGRQLQLSAKSPRWRVSLEAWQPLSWPPRQFTFEVENRMTGARSQFKLHGWTGGSQALLLEQIDELSIFRGRLLILGRVGANFSEADVAELPSGRVLDRFPCFRPALSPGRRFLAFVKDFPGHPGPVSINDVYLVYDLAASPQLNRSRARPGAVVEAGLPVFPPGAVNTAGSNIVPGANAQVHSMVSRWLFWLGSDEFAFVDRWHDVNSLVVADLSGGVRHPRVTVRKIDTSRLVDFATCADRAAPSDLERWKESPGILIYVQDIQKVPRKPGWARLTLLPNECLKTTTFDIHVGAHVPDR